MPVALSPLVLPLVRAAFPWALVLATLPAAAILTLAPTVAADSTIPQASIITHTYDEFTGNGNRVGSFYSGFTYSGEDQVACDYNSLYYPATTPPCVMGPWNTGVFSITANNGFTSFTKYEADISYFTWETTLTGFDAAGNQVATETCGGSLGFHTTHCSIMSLTPMKKVTVSGEPDYYLLDTSVFTLNNPPTACFQHVEAGLSTNVIGACSIDLDGTPVASWTWNWGDGSFAGSGMRSSHTYATPGHYTVTLTTVDNAGAWSSTAQSVTVAALPNPCPQGVNPLTLAACGAGPVCPTGVTSPPGPGQAAVVCGVPVNEPAPCPSPTVGVDPECHTAGQCSTGYGVQVDGSPTCIGSLGAPTGVKSCAVYNSVYTPAPYPGQDGIVVEFDPPGQAGDVALCAGTVSGSPCAAGQPGVRVNNGLTCVPTPPAPCAAPSIGIQPDCHTVSLCSSGSVGVQVDSTPVCVPLPMPCPVPSIGVQPDCHTVAACSSGLGVQVDSTPVCTPSPIVCPLPSLGIQNYGGCHTVGACNPPATVGATVDGAGACVPPPTLCNPSPGAGWTVGIAGTCAGLPWVVPGAASPCTSAATVNARVYWGTTPGFMPGSTFDVCL